MDGYAAAMVRCGRIDGPAPRAVFVTSADRGADLNRIMDVATSIPGRCGPIFVVQSGIRICWDSLL